MPYTPRHQRNPHIAPTGPIDWPAELLALIKQRAAGEDENLSAYIRKVMAAHVGWTGPTRNIKDYSGSS